MLKLSHKDQTIGNQFVESRLQSMEKHLVDMATGTIVTGLGFHAQLQIFRNIIGSHWCNIFTSTFHTK